MDLPSFIERWLESSGAEASNAQPFIIELCEVLGVAKPLPVTGKADPDADTYVFESDALIQHEARTVSVGKIDLYKRDCCSKLPNARGPMWSQPSSGLFWSAPSMRRSATA
ncbi:MAG: hypothetical protein L6Q76_22140 [Polyangiaceae bacterium]|nr:hypothetical protein [Polyangiaceae bacterium]